MDPLVRILQKYRIALIYTEGNLIVFELPNGIDSLVYPSKNVPEIYDSMDKPGTQSSYIFLQF